jgi:hypothetical protein
MPDGVEPVSGCFRTDAGISKRLAAPPLQTATPDEQ